ncbi:MAG: hypothetical protein GY788_15680 [bacterium]|nr:hypothetical protein [bacterium]
MEVTAYLNERMTNVEINSRKRHRDRQGQQHRVDEGLQTGLIGDRIA